MLQVPFGSRKFIQRNPSVVSSRIDNLVTVRHKGDQAKECLGDITIAKTTTRWSSHAPQKH